MTKDPATLLNELCACIDNNDVPGVRRALANGVNPNTLQWSDKCQIRFPALGRAWTLIDKKQWPIGSDLLACLVEGGAAVNECYGRIVFEYALDTYDLSLVRLFFQKGFQLHGQVWPLWTKDLACMRYFVEEQGLPVNVSLPDRGTPLHSACLFRNEGQIRYLLSRGANINAMDGQRNTPLIQAVKTGADDLVPLLLENSADPKLCNFQGNTALHYVSDAATALMLMDYGADLHAVNKEGLTPLDIGDPEALAVIEHRELSKLTHMAKQPQHSHARL